MLEGLACFQYTLPVHPHYLGYNFIGTGHSLAFSKESSSHSHRSKHWPAPGSHPALHAPQTAYPAAVAPLTLLLWHERLDHRALDAVERAVQHVKGLTIDFKGSPPHHCPACATGKQHRDPFLPSHHMHATLLKWYKLT